MKYDSRLRDHIDQLYRQNSLATHLRQTRLFAGLDKAQLKRVVDAMNLRHTEASNGN